MTRLASEQILDLQQPLTWTDRAIELVLAATLIFTPAAIGTMQPWSQQIWFVAVAVMAVLMTVNLVTNRQSQLVWTWAYVPIVLYLLLVALSLIPLPAGVLKVISPGTIEQKTALLSDLPNVAELTAKSTISFNVWSTERGLRIVLALAVVFIVAVNTFRTPQQIKRLLIMIVAAGAAVTVLALLQDFTAEPGTLYWVMTWDVQSPHPRSGPFFGHAQMGQYMNLTLGATLALVLVLIGENFAGEDLTAREVFERLGEPGMRFVYVLLVLIAAMVCASVLSASRGAMISMAAAGVVAAVLILIKRGWRERETPAVITSLVVAGVVAGAVLWYVVFPRIFTYSSYNIGTTLDNRAAIRAQVPRMIAKWPVMGTGLQSFEWVYPWFQPATSGRNIADHAENDYLQTLTDTGIVGALITGGFLAIIAYNWSVAVRGRLPIHLASIGVAFAMTAVMVHSVADFAQRTPAIGMVSALLCAITVSLARIHTRHVPAEASPRFGFSPLPRLALGVAMVAVLGWAIWSVQGVRMGDANYWLSDPTYTGNLDPNESNYDAKLVAFFDKRIDGCETALKYDPQAVRYIHYLNDFRWRKLSRQRDPKTHQIIFADGAAAKAKEIVKELSEARALCPTYGPLYILQGKVQWELFDKEQGRSLLKRGHELKPINPEVNFYLAEVAAADGDWDTAAARARDCVRQDTSYRPLILDLYLERYQQPERAFDVFKDDGQGLHMLSQVLPKDNVELQKRISDRTIAELTARVEKDQPNDAGVMVNLAQQLDSVGRKADAADYVAKALRLEYGRTDWRLYRARLLRDLNRIPEAITETEIVLRVNQQSNEAKALLDDLQDPRRSRKP